MSSLLVHSTGDTSPIRLVRVSNCRRFFNLDAFGLSMEPFRVACLSHARDCFGFFNFDAFGRPPIDGTSLSPHI
jgi:hypothetical protein